MQHDALVRVRRVLWSIDLYHSSRQDELHRDSHKNIANGYSQLRLRSYLGQPLRLYYLPPWASAIRTKLATGISVEKSGKSLRGAEFFSWFLDHPGSINQSLYRQGF